MANLKGEMIFQIRPDYNQDVDDVRHTIPDTEYKFTFNQDQGLQLSVEEIHFHFNKFLRSLGYQIPLTDSEGFLDEDDFEEVVDDVDGQ
tara:strand:- start:200 stop:466 length:267 start_codon:yes stop_codon:yes gene_type:complete